MNLSARLMILRVAILSLPSTLMADGLLNQLPQTPPATLTSFTTYFDCETRFPHRSNEIDSA